MSHRDNILRAGVALRASSRDSMMCPLLAICFFPWQLAALMIESHDVAEGEIAIVQGR